MNVWRTLGVGVRRDVRSKKLHRLVVPLRIASGSWKRACSGIRNTTCVVRVHGNGLVLTADIEDLRWLESTLKEKVRNDERHLRAWGREQEQIKVLNKFEPVVKELLLQDAKNTTSVWGCTTRLRNRWITKSS